ncbi:MAG: CRISPR-associated CARF protein Csa3 [Ignisphaera sp.]|uniref:CRISPR locus-related DNA-binding protein n=1 Tax=Ignisphaera aggregans TaxID=334771 RepID=A0A7C4JLE7_9CREN
MSGERLFICSLGFDERFVVRCLVRHHFGEGDIVRLITVEPLEERVEGAYRRVEELVNRLGGSIELITVNCTDMDIAISQVIEIIKNLDRDTIVNLSGGMRILICLILLALTIVQPKAVVKVELETEDLRRTIEIPLELLKLPSFNIGGTKLKIAKVISCRANITISELAVDIGKDKSLVSRHIKAMEKVNLIHTERRGKIKFIRPTNTLKALIKS